MELKKLVPGTKTFECGGKKYVIHDSLSFERFKKLEEFSLEFGYSATFKDVFVNLRKAWDMLNTLKLAEAAIIIHNVMKGITILEGKDNVAFRISALFISSEDEDITEYDEIKMKEKINTWARELDVAFFFNFSIAIVPSFMPVYRIVSENILEK